MFVPVVTLISVFTAVLWLIIGKSFDFALSNAISVLVISCPCALGLATPVAITVAVGKLAGEGILFKSAEALETLHKTNVAVFDKTGTLTKGSPKVTDTFAISDDDNDLLSLALSLEEKSEHPLGRAICEYALSRGTVAFDYEDFSAVPGRGVRARVNSQDCFAGNITYMIELGIDVSAYEKRIEKLLGEGKTVMLFARASRLIGFFAASDEISENAKETLEELKSLGVETVMLTGDNKLSAEKVAKALGIDRVVSGVLPSEKGSTVESLGAGGRTVIMIGDGINDAPALTAAHVGIALGAGTDIAIDSADAVLVKNDLLGVSRAVRYSRSVMTNIKENLFWAFFYNAICIPVAAGALYPLGITLSPMLASAAMSLSSIFVVCNALRLYRK